MDPEQLAKVTAKSCFMEADKDKDGLISFPEFFAWFAGRRSAAVKEMQFVAGQTGAFSSMKQINAAQLQGEGSAFMRGQSGAVTRCSSDTLEDIRRATGLGNIPTADVVEMLREEIAAGALDRERFVEYVPFLPLGAAKL